MHASLREVKNSFFPSDTLIYGIYRDGMKSFNIRTCEHMILSQLRMGAHQTKNAPLLYAKTHEGQNESLAQISGANFQANPWIRNQSFNKYLKVKNLY